MQPAAAGAGPAGVAVGSGSAAPPYTPPPTHDEMLDERGAVRPAWASLARTLAERPTRFSASRRAIRRRLRADGATFGPATSAEPVAPWELDAVPFVLDGAEFDELARGLTQRARLLAAVLADTYGHRRLLADRSIPPAALFGNPGFLRASHQLSPARPLARLAVDVVRRGDGRFAVLADHAGAPVGIGYTLENRAVMVDALGGLMRTVPTRRISPAVAVFAETANSIARERNGRTVLLSPGPTHPAFFEHAYLADHLDIPLVSGADLTVRGGKVWLRTIGGLEAVGAIIRDLDDRHSDPLRLLPDGSGVAGLLEAARRANVVLLNPVGTGVVDSPAIAAHLGSLAPRLLGEDLLLDELETHWCGHPADLEVVLDSLDGMIIEPAWSRQPAAVGSRLGADELDAWRARLRAEPTQWSARRQTDLATTPGLAEGSTSLVPLTARLRFSLFADEDGNWTVAPGALAVTARPGELLVASQALPPTALVKDVWILAEPGSRATRARPVGDPGLRTDLASRAAENLFWLGRHTERASGIIHLVRVISQTAAELREVGHGADDVALADLLDLLEDLTWARVAPPPLGAEALLAEFDLVVAEAVTDPAQGRLTDSLRLAVRAATAVRDRLATEAQSIVVDLDEELANLRQADDLVDLRATMGAVARALDAFAGLANESMDRDAGWRFLDVGRRLGRARWTIRALAKVVPVRTPDVESVVLGSILAVCDSASTYRRRHRAQVRPVPALDLLVIDPTNPRSIRFQLDRMTEGIATLPLSRTGYRLHPIEKHLLEARTALQLADPEHLVAHTEDGARGSLALLLERLESLLDEAAAALSDTFFTHVDTRPRVVGRDTGPEL
ncbi:MAG: circularly permuted type 2 ATP-grasp protein [Actinomycetota bacterium]|nr:circularly permuted type 2 ATP-grasp protein [Actinomycetota bacterium]